MNISTKKLFLVTAAFVVLSCSSEKPSETMVSVPPGQATQESGSSGNASGARDQQTGSLQTSLEILPADATRQSTLTLRSQGFDLKDASVEWFLNGSPASAEPTYQLDASRMRKGDAVVARATVQGKEVASARITIRNAPPAISKLKIMPETFKPGDTLYVDAEATDADGDDVTIAYRWMVNGEAAGESKKIDTAIKRGDVIEIRITPTDGETSGTTVVMKREIKNMPPMISGNEKVQFDGAVFSFQVPASDPDGDELSYSLKAAPDGMTIKKDTGLISWNVPKEFTGKAEFTAVVSDGNGGESTKSYSLDIAPGPKKASTP